MDEDLARRLEGLPMIDADRTVAEVLDRARKRRRVRAAVRFVVVAAAMGLLSVAWWRANAHDPQPRGHAVVDAAVYVEAVAEGPRGRRPLADGATLQADEQVVFRITTSTEGELSLSENGSVVWPVGEVWDVDAGRHYLGSPAHPLAWTPDDGPHGVHEVVATLCPAAGACVSDHFVVGWR